MNKSLVFSGGGIKGYIFIGIIKQLETKYNIHKDFNNYYGTSIGGLVAFLLSIGYSSLEFENIFLSIDLNKLLNIDINEIIHNYGLINHNNIIELLIKLFEHKKIDYTITYNDFYNLYKKNFCCVATEISTEFVEQLFSYKTTPDIKIIDSLIATMNIPIIFDKWVINGKYYIDGVFVNNFPIDHTEFNNFVIGFYFNNIIKNSDNHDNMFSYTLNIIKCVYIDYMRQQKNKLEIYNNIDNIKLNKIENIGVHSVEFNVSDTTKKQLIEFGFTYKLNI